MKKMKKIKIIFGKLLYKIIGTRLPISYSRINIGQRKFRAFCGKLMLAECGKDVNIEPKSNISEKVHLGDRSGIGINADICGTTFIGNDVMMGPNCTIYTQNHRFDDLTVPMNRQGFEEERPVYIGDDVWLGGNVTILPGVKIGSHCVIGANSVVTKDIPQWAVAVGNPATVKKFRNQQ